MSRNLRQGLVEYALIIVLIAIVAIGIYSVIGSQRATCSEGYFWSYQERACLPGYRPGGR